ncbi:hypothetical protein SKAU_G00239590 [Synaphobranchus kaupii]|uniref:Uncharacterized protein n=1 Tax=Synaphobranchus kaupii TaxID=118154 RepID=A0A9Q1F7C9_SYNKA|nr:hypothetical protein SKAU_G00239590 [Synaphobranchus kaupii]
MDPPEEEPQTEGVLGRCPKVEVEVGGRRFPCLFQELIHQWAGVFAAHEEDFADDQIQGHEAHCGAAFGYNEPHADDYVDTIPWSGPNLLETDITTDLDMCYWLNRGARPKNHSTPTVSNPELWTDIDWCKRRFRNNKHSSTDVSPEIRLENRYIVLDELPFGEPSGDAMASISTASSEANAKACAAVARDTAKPVRSVSRRHPEVNNRPKAAKANITSLKRTASQHNMHRTLEKKLISQTRHQTKHSAGR